VTRQARLAEIRRGLGPYVALQGSEPFRLCDAEIARRLVGLIEIVDGLATELDEARAALKRLP